jgi:hypothetical protein
MVVDCVEGRGSETTKSRTLVSETKPLAMDTWLQKKHGTHSFLRAPDDFYFFNSKGTETE